MNATIADALAGYNEEVARFAAWVSPNDQGNPGPRWGTEEYFPWYPRSEPGGWSTRENTILTVWNAKLKGMEAALGLTFEEIRVAYEKAGLPTSIKAQASIIKDWHYGVEKILRSVPVPIEPATTVAEGRDAASSPSEASSASGA